MGTPPRPSPDPQNTIPHKRALDDEHAPSIPSPLNPDAFTSKATPVATMRDKLPIHREPREKKESLKKREAKNATSPAAGSTGRGTPGPATATAAPSSALKNSTNTMASKPKVHIPSGPLRYKLPPPKPIDYTPPKAPLLTPSHTQNSTQFYTSSEHVYNRKGFRYSHCIADPLFPSTLQYRQSDAPPYTARINHEDSSSHILFNESATHITTTKGFRMARANVGIREGRWYWECRITSGIPASGDPHGHVRVGFARREAPLDAPVGFDAYSYGLRDMGGQKVHMSRPVDFLPPASSGETQHFVEGDVLGLEISLPPLSLHQKIVSGDYNPAVDSPSLPVPPHEPAPDIIRDRVPIHYKSNLYFESYEYHATKELEELTHPSPHPTTTSASSSSASQPPNPTHPSVHLRTLPGSYIKVYRNGRSIGKPFENLLAFLPPASKPQNIGSGAQAREGLDDGLCGYFPAVSVFKSGAAECNFGPDWWCPPDESPQDQDRDHEGDVDMDAASQTMRKAVAERYDEQIAEDVVWDIIDEVDFWLQDGAASRVAAAGATIGGSLTQPVAASKGVAAAPGAASCVSANRRPTAIPSLDGAADEVAFADTSGDLTMNTISSAVPAGVALTQPVIPGSSTALEDGTTDEIKELIQEDE